MRRDRAGKIDRALTGKAELRAELEALVRDEGSSIPDVIRFAAQRLGVKVSTSGANRWILKIKGRDVQPPRSLLAPVVRKVAHMREPELQKLAQHLGVTPKENQ